MGWIKSFLKNPVKAVTGSLERLADNVVDFVKDPRTLQVAAVAAGGYGIYSAVTGALTTTAAAASEVGAAAAAESGAVLAMESSAATGGGFLGNGITLSGASAASSVIVPGFAAETLGAGLSTYAATGAGAASYVGLGSTAATGAGLLSTLKAVQPYVSAANTARQLLAPPPQLLVSQVPGRPGYVSPTNPASLYDIAAAQGAAAKAKQQPAQTIVLDQVEQGPALGPIVAIAGAAAVLYFMGKK